MRKVSMVAAMALVMFGLNGAGLAQQSPSAEAPKTEAPKTEAPKPTAPEAPRVVDTVELYKPGPIPEAILGRDDAPVTIVEYASLTCPHCATFHNKTLPILKRDYIDTGKVRFIFRDFPFDVVAMAGSMLARCAPKEKQFDVLAELFAKQEQWAFSKEPEKELTALALRNGFTQESFDACLQKQEIYDGVLAVRRRGHEAFQIDSTPTLFVNGVVYRGSLSPEQMEIALKPHLEKK